MKVSLQSQRVSHIRHTHTHSSKLQQSSNERPQSCRQVFAVITVLGLSVASQMAAASHLAVPVAAAPVVPAAVNTGASSQYRSQDNLGQYSFGYDEAGATGGSFRHEKSDALGNRIGSYGLTGADGRVRVVNYVADANGYRATVQTNEPGTEPRDTANVAMNKGAPIAVAAPAPVAVAAPAPVPVAAAPVAYPAAAHPAYLPAAAPVAPVAAPFLAQAPILTPAGFGFTVINHHVAPLPAY